MEKLSTNPGRCRVHGNIIGYKYGYLETDVGFQSHKCQLAINPTQRKGYGDFDVYSFALTKNQNLINNFNKGIAYCHPQGVLDCKWFDDGTASNHKRSWYNYNDILVIDYPAMYDATRVRKLEDNTTQRYYFYNDITVSTLKINGINTITNPSTIEFDVVSIVGTIQLSLLDIGGNIVIQEISANGHYKLVCDGSKVSFYRDNVLLAQPKTLTGSHFRFAFGLNNQNEGIVFKNFNICTIDNWLYTCEHFTTTFDPIESIAEIQTFTNGYKLVIKDEYIDQTTGQDNTSPFYMLIHQDGIGVAIPDGANRILFSTTYEASPHISSIMVGFVYFDENYQYISSEEVIDIANVGTGNRGRCSVQSTNIPSNAKYVSVEFLFPNGVGRYTNSAGVLKNDYFSMELNCLLFNQTYGGFVKNG